MRLRMDIAYDGGAFHGWARQPGLRTVQGVVESALGRVLRLEEVALICAGRTDAGVHARGQVVHVDVPDAALDATVGRSTASPPAALLRRLNGVLPNDVRVHRVSEADAAFDARFSALWRRYTYRIADVPDAVDPLGRAHVLAWPRELDLDAMNKAAVALLGEHDFAAFCKSREGATTIRTLRRLEWERGGGLAVVTVVANAFCHHMVRSLVSCLVAVGDGRRPCEWPGAVLTAARRDPAVGVLPAHGLTLEEVGYPPDAGVGG